MTAGPGRAKVPHPAMKPTLLALLLGLPLVAADQPATKPEAGAEKVAVKAKAKPADPAMAPIKDVAGLPRVLLIGDSISIGYTLTVRKLLDGKANVHRIPTNGGPTSNGVANLATWLGKDKWDVIHFNFGLHDLKIMPGGKRQVEPADYESNLRALVTELRKTGAKLVFATTTPVPEGKLATPRNSADVALYNQIALKVMTEHGVAIDDLNAAITPHLAKLQRPHDVHYTAEGSEALGQAVVKSLEKASGK